MSKYKYYFKKPRAEITKDIFKILLISGLIIIASTSPYFAENIIKGIKRARKYSKINKYSKKKIYNTFYQLRKHGDIKFHYRGKQLYIFLTEKGKKKAGWMQIDELRIKKPKKWDGKWRIIMFDIAELKKIYREVLRGKLKEMGLQIFQKSAWITPYDCKDEIELIKNFFGFTDKEVKLITTQDIGNDIEFRRIFNL
jgi:hypothetical protein